MDHDTYSLLNRYWWLIFPVFGMFMGVVGMWQRHSRVNRTIDIIKSYADQGKEPPPELLAALRDPDANTTKQRRGVLVVPIFLFGALCAGFVMFALWPGMGFGPRQMVPFFFVALVMGAMCLAFLVMAILARRADQGMPR